MAAPPGLGAQQQGREDPAVSVHASGAISATVWSRAQRPPYNLRSATLARCATGHDRWNRHLPPGSGTAGQYIGQTLALLQDVKHVAMTRLVLPNNLLSGAQSSTLVSHRIVGIEA